MTDQPAHPSPADTAERVARLEAALAAIGAALEGHAAWLSDLQRGASDAAQAIPQLSAENHRNVEWLDTLERWVSSCVRTLANYGAQPIADGGANNSDPPDVTRSLQSRLEVWAVMRWIEDAAVVDEGSLVSVVTATRNRPELLRSAASSVLGQSYGNLELIVVDDGDVGDAAATLAVIDDARVRVVRTASRRGAAAAFNAGIDAARGSLITALDDDNLMHRNWLRSVVWAFTAFPHVDALYGARINEDPGATRSLPSGMLPTLEFLPYDRRRHEKANFIDRNTIAFRATLRDIRYDETLPSAIDWDHSLRMFARAAPLPLPAVACYYRTLVPGRCSDDDRQSEGVRIVRDRARAARPFRVHVHTEMYPVISETYIGEDIRSLQDCGAVVTVSALSPAVSAAGDAPPCRLDVDQALSDAAPDIVLMHWATHAEHELATMERWGLPFACRVHTFDVDPAVVQRLLEHPLCVAVFAHPHHVPLLPDGVVPLIPIVGPSTVIPDSPKTRDLVLSASAGLPKRDFPLLIEAFARIPERERMLILARTNGVADLPDEVERLAAVHDPAIAVRVNVQRPEVLAAMARASVLVYVLRGDSPMGFPMSIVEAMLCGTIVIAPDRPEAHAIVGEHLRPYRDADDIVRHVREVAAGGPEVDAARAALRQRGQRHRDPAELRRLHDSLRDALAQWSLRHD